MIKYLILSLFFSVHVMAEKMPTNGVKEEFVGKTLRDPTKPLNFKSVKNIKRIQKTALPHLQSILLHGDAKQAIMNDRLYKKGEKVNGYTVISIKKDSVKLKYKNKYYIVKLYKKNNLVIN